MHLGNRIIGGAAFLAALVLGSPCGVGQDKKVPLVPEGLEKLQRLIKPGAGEARWAEVAWMPSGDIWGARQRAAAQGKPLFLWYMAGEPLGTC